MRRIFSYKAFRSDAGLFGLLSRDVFVFVMGASPCTVIVGFSLVDSPDREDGVDSGVAAVLGTGVDTAVTVSSAVEVCFRVFESSTGRGVTEDAFEGGAGMDCSACSFPFVTTARGGACGRTGTEEIEEAEDGVAPTLAISG